MITNINMMTQEIKEPQSTEAKEPEYLSAYQYAERKGVSNTAVYSKIKRGKITTVRVGKSKFIDWNTNSEVTFENAARYKKED